MRSRAGPARRDEPLPEWERELYQTAGTTAEAPTAEAPTAEVPAAEVPAAEVPAAEVPAAEAPIVDAPTTDRVPTPRRKDNRTEMATVTAADVKKLRDLTGAGMMDSKKALEEADGDIDKAVDVLRIKAGAKIQKRARRAHRLQWSDRRGRGRHDRVGL